MESIDDASEAVDRTAGSGGTPLGLVVGLKKLKAKAGAIEQRGGSYIQSEALDLMSYAEALETEALEYLDENP